MLLDCCKELAPFWPVGLYGSAMSQKQDKDIMGSSGGPLQTITNAEFQGTSACRSHVPTRRTPRHLLGRLSASAAVWQKHGRCLEMLWRKPHRGVTGSSMQLATPHFYIKPLRGM